MEVSDKVFGATGDIVLLWQSKTRYEVNLNNKVSQLHNERQNNNQNINFGNDIVTLRVPKLNDVILWAPKLNDKIMPMWSIKMKNMLRDLKSQIYV